MAKHIIDGLMRWVEREEWIDSFGDHFAIHLGPACAGTEVDPDSLLDMLDEENTRVIWGVVFEDFATFSDENGRNLIDDYLKRRGFMENTGAKLYLKALRHSHMSLYEISDVVRDTGFMARDMITGGEPVLVHERSGTHTLKQCDILAARIVTVQGRTQMCGGCLVFDRPAADRLMDLLGEMAEGKHASIAETLPDAAFAFTNVWVSDILDRFYNPPELVNSDGDPIRLITVRYPLARGAKQLEISDILDCEDWVRRDGKTSWSWIAPDGGLPEDDEDDVSDGYRVATNMEDGTVVLGQIELKGRELILSVNSEKRAEYGRKYLEVVLGDYFGTAHIDVQDWKDASAALPAQPHLPLEDRQDVLAQYLDRHYRTTLDTPVPMLDGLSPREAAKTEATRPSVVEWLKYIENGSAKHETVVYDTLWMWEELELTAYRK